MQPVFCKNNVPKDWSPFYIWKTKQDIEIAGTTHVNTPTLLLLVIVLYWAIMKWRSPSTKVRTQEEKEPSTRPIKESLKEDRLRFWLCAPNWDSHRDSSIMTVAKPSREAPKLNLTPQGDEIFDFLQRHPPLCISDTSSWSELIPCQFRTPSTLQEAPDS